jgi:F-type H+-transporting ATPase subunit gamma
MQNLQALQRSINSAKNLQSIVSTMKAFASSNIAQFQSAANASFTYRHVLDMALYALLSREEKKPGYRQEKAGATIHIVFGSDHGLAGRFNERIVSYIGEQIPAGDDHVVITVGQQLLLRLSGEIPITESLSMPQTEDGITAVVQKLLLAMDQLQEEMTVTQIILYYNKPLEGATFAEETEILLPVDLEGFAQKITRWESRSIPNYFIEKEDLLADLIRQYIFITLYRTFAYSLASENASRLASMQAAEKNIEERLEELTSDYRRQRQNSITEEINDINAGFRAIKKTKEGQESAKERAGSQKQGATRRI